MRGRARPALGAAGLVAASCLATSVIGAAAETARERGAYLVETLAACAGCHTPRTATGLGPALSGGNTFGPPRARTAAPNITPDQATGIGAWSDGQLIDAIRRGVRPDGTRIRGPMPQTAYRGMSDADAAAIVAYLRSVPPVAHRVPRSDGAGPPAAETRRDDGWLERLRSSASASDRLARGRYIAIALLHCAECHTPVPLDAPEAAAQMDAGGKSFKTRDGTVVAPGIRASDLDRFSDDALAAIVTKGIRPDGSRLRGPMPVASYATIRQPDLAALIAFLRADRHP